MILKSQYRGVHKYVIISLARYRSVEEKASSLYVRGKRQSSKIFIYELVVKFLNYRAVKKHVLKTFVRYGRWYRIDWYRYRIPVGTYGNIRLIDFADCTPAVNGIVKV